MSPTVKSPVNEQRPEDAALDFIPLEDEYAIEVLLATRSSGLRKKLRKIARKSHFFRGAEFTPERNLKCRLRPRAHMTFEELAEQAIPRLEGKIHRNEQATPPESKKQRRRNKGYRNKAPALTT